MPRVAHPKDMPPPHDLANERRLRKDIESLLRTYPEVLEVWPESKSDLWARLADGRQVDATIRFT